ncbi:type IV toxin-antitoxin system AbiEi family antitoxin domain-containing protein [Gracilimonas sp.]|uniref:type IV toxin-antitoxin system AbiEi family antitoxin domain-containing protein n=1 Tax=Gracilimonas sp. TaxID=1974203 RepID=UPI003D1484A0
MYISQSKIEEAVKLFQEHDGVMRTSEVLDAGVHRRTLYHMRDEGMVTAIQRGVYQLAESEPLSKPDLVIVAKKIPEARICLISALSIHEMTDEIPHKVHIALPRSSWQPELDYPPLKVYRFSEETINSGVEPQTIDGVEVKVFNPAKTIADCFKFRNQIGLDVAIEALKRGVKEGKATYGDIMKYAKLCKVERVIKPYLETVGHG